MIKEIKDWAFIILAFLFVGSLFVLAISEPLLKIWALLKYVLS